MASDHWQLPGVAHFVALACAALHRGLLLSFNMFQLILEQVHICQSTTFQRVENMLVKLEHVLKPS